MPVSIWKKISLLLWGFLHCAVFAGVWVGLIFWETAWAPAFVYTCAALLVFFIILHLILPILRLFP